MLEARLNATASAYAPYLSQTKPEQHFMRIGHWFAEAGIGEARCRSFLGEVAAPLDRAQRHALGDLFEMLWRGGLQAAAPADQRDYARLCQPDSPECVLDLPDYCAFFTYTMFSGVVRK
jgi:demethylmenaquinone methyltransferase/2-methoxy-6-polyprenyl-1,4-benzoquinol methylase